MRALTFQIATLSRCGLPSRTNLAAGRAAIGHALRGCSGCGCSVFLWIFAFAVTGSYGFAQSTLEGPLYPVVYLLGWLAPLAALVYLVRELATAFNERGGVKTKDQPQ